MASECGGEGGWGVMVNFNQLATMCPKVLSDICSDSPYSNVQEFFDIQYVNVKTGRTLV